MAATAKVRLLVECEGLGQDKLWLSELFTDTNTPDDYRKVETIISTTATLLSSIVNVPSSEVLGLGIVAKDGDVYVNTVSTNISTKGSFVPSGQCQFMSFKPGNNCKITIKGGDADTAMAAIIYAAATA